MSVKNQNSKILFGLKVKQLRNRKSLSFAELSRQSGLSVSYLNEIEKGKKYPKQDKIDALAAAFGIKSSQLTSMDFDEGMAPVADLLKSNFLNELPLDLFGIDLGKVVEIIATAPARVGAFITTLLDMARNYSLREENFYLSALRSYLELNRNYFPELEGAVAKFQLQHNLPEERPFSGDQLRQLLEDKYHYQIIDNGLDKHPELKNLRSVFLPKKRKLLLSSELTPMQRSFQFGKELAFNYLNLKERAHTSSLLSVKSFEEVLNHAQSIYFSVALHMPLNAFNLDIERFFALPRWDGEAFLAIMHKYDASPEMMFHRLTNVLPENFGLDKLFFLRFSHNVKNNKYEIDKELHLSRRHQPHGNGLHEHYCRRWVSISLLEDLRNMQKEGKYVDTIVRAQTSRYLKGDDEYLCLTIARPAYPAPNKNVSVTLGLLITDELREKVAFLKDSAIVHREVHTTCERCPLLDCKERAIEPEIVQKRERLYTINQKLNELM